MSSMNTVITPLQKNTSEFRRKNSLTYTPPSLCEGCCSSPSSPSSPTFCFFFAGLVGETTVGGFGRELLLCGVTSSNTFVAENKYPLAPCICMVGRVREGSTLFDQLVRWWCVWGNREAVT